MNHPYSEANQQGYGNELGHVRKVKNYKRLLKSMANKKAISPFSREMASKYCE